ncbi:universal stress protein [Halorubrum vacuolatum]|uniref:Nucleotide-binding universal stress protein, UspA family n=1 Tax=Halorubrum vacuolatum TaxID=63740 RepID=A0A238YEQ7_HALVU|nr:universal stress protein [Halorubrum vacuolatum]SNR69074.1 Nucleotide-binding universal stress protein, UspA family [Halorubrum vacuolatum]
MFDDVLIPTDGTDPANKAAHKGIDLAAAHGSRVHVISVVEPMSLGRFTAGAKPASAEQGEVVEELRAAAKAAIDSVTDMCKERGIEAVGTLRYGKPEEVILEYAEDEGIDAIVMGTHGRDGTKRLIVGSVTEKVVRRSSVPVVTVRPTE